jgi:N6-L-threonylcarbamoyladenine synthase
MALVLGIESTCDETAAAVVRDGRRVLSSIVATQVDLHAKYRGVVPEIASRAHIESILPIIREALDKAGVALGDIDAVAVAHRPGLIGSLLIGVTAAKSLAWVLGRPLIGVDHVHAHLYSVTLSDPAPHQTKTSHSLQAGARNGRDAAAACQTKSQEHPADDLDQATAALAGGPADAAESAPLGAQGLGDLPFPAVGLVCSGGHTALYRLDSWGDVRLIGSTIDDAVGEAYDKVASILGLGYPGGPIIDQLAQEGDGSAVRFPRTLLGRTSLDFSFSGLKTAVLYHVRGVPGREPPKSPPGGDLIRDIAASFQSACIDVIMTKLRRAIGQTGGRCVIVGGGVSANRGLRRSLGRLGVPVYLPPLRYCTDNAAMIAGLGNELLRQGRTATLDLDAVTFSGLTEEKE